MLNHLRRRVSACTFRFPYRTSKGRIAPSKTPMPDTMNEELRQASELAKDPSSVPYIVYLWVMGLSTLGGIVRVLREVKLGGKTLKKIIVTLLVEVIISNFAGILTFFLCMSRGIGQFETISLASLAAYMGPRALNALEAIWKAKSTKE